MRPPQTIARCHSGESLAPQLPVPMRPGTDDKVQGPAHCTHPNSGDNRFPEAHIVRAYRERPERSCCEAEGDVCQEALTVFCGQGTKTPVLRLDTALSATGKSFH